MKHFIGDQEVTADAEALELALDLYLGPEEETDEERDARLDAGRDLIAEDPELFDYAARVVAKGLARSRDVAGNVVPLGSGRAAVSQGVAA